MGKISNYARVLVAKLQDVLVIDTTDSNVTTTKSVTVEQIGDTIAGTQVHSDLKTDNQTIIGGINELAKAKNIADEYDDTHTYNIGDITIYGNTLYICQDDNVTGDFDPTKWTATTVQSLIGSLSSLTTTNKDSLVDAVNEVNGGFAGYVIKEYTNVMPNTQTNTIIPVDTGVSKGILLGCIAHRNGDNRSDIIPTGITGALAHMDIMSYDDGTLSLRAYIDSASGVSVFGGASFTAICAVKYS